MEVRLVVTGKCERLALGSSLGRVFGAPTRFVTADGEVHSFSSTTLASPSSRLLDTIDKFADRLLREVDEHDNALVIGVDDLELDNTAWVTVEAVRAAVQRRLAGRWSGLSARERAAEKLRTRCSFHLTVPLLEAYFFGEAAALQRAGCTAPSLFDPAARDPEDFAVDDPAYLSEPELTPERERNPERRKRTWAKALEQRRRHPKLYLKYLCSPNDSRVNRYHEAEGGRRALELLAWAKVLAKGSMTRFARSLFADVADFLGVASPFRGDEHELTSRHAQRAERTLRNI